MSVTVKHPFVSAVPDSADTSLVRPSNWNADHTIIGLGTAAEKDVGVANGVASLDSGGKVPVSELPAAVLGALSYQGTWNASTNSPTLASGVGTKGYYYVVSVAGSTNLDGVTDWLVGDWAVYNGTAWQKVDNTDQVTSVNGQTGAVVLTTTNIAEGTNEYFTTARARASVSAGTGISYDSSTGVITNASPSLGGDVVGPTGATDNAVARYDTTTGKLLQNSLVIIGDTGSVTGVNALTAESLTVNNNVTLGSSNTDTLDVRSRISSDLDPETNNAKDIGTNGRNWRDGFFGRTLHTVNLDVTGTTSFDGSQGTSGQVLTSAGTGNTPAWTTPTTGTVTSVGGTGTVNGLTLTGTVTTSGNLTLGGTLDLSSPPAIGGTTPNSGSFSSITDSGNLTFTGTGNRITGDFSNATIANRVAFQTSTVNGTTGVAFAPNGTGAVGGIACFNNSDLANSSAASFRAASSLVEIISGITGTGTYLPMVFNNGGSEAMRITTDRNVGIGTANPAGFAGRNFVVQNTGTSSVATLVGDYSSGVTSMVSTIEALGGRNDGNGTFGGRHAAAYRRSDGTAIAATATIGYYAFGGQWGTDTSYQSAKVLYAASIGGVAEGSFTSATAMPTAITFRTGSTGEAISSVNTSYGTERMRLDSSGNLLVGTTSSLSSGSHSFINTSGGVTPLSLRHASSTAGRYWFTGPDSSSNFIVYNNNSVGVYLAYGGTSWSSSSDERLKTDLIPISNAAAKVLSLRAVTGRYKTDTKGVSRAFLIAQDVQAVFPEAINQQNDEINTLGLQYTDVIPLLVAAFTELKAEFDQYKLTHP